MASKGKAEAKSGGILDTFWDIAIVGAGYSGFAATLAAVAAGKKVLLIDPRCDLLWESAISRNPVTGKLPPEMRPFMHAMEMATGIAEDWIDPGSAEWVANGLLLDAKVERLYYATPVAANISKQGIVDSVTFALLDRLVAISAAQWIDATEDGILARACGLQFEAPAPIKRIYRFFFQRSRWPLKFPFDIFTGIYGAYAQIEDSAWSSEKIVRLEIGNAFKGEPLDVVEPFLTATRKRLAAKCPDALLSHWSWAPYPLFPKQVGAISSPGQNLAIAVPLLSPAPVETIGDRCSLGASACARLLNSRRAAKKPTSAPKPIAPTATGAIEADVCVDGIGTAGLMAAVAAARGGAKVVALEAAQTIGGMATIGGVRSYFMGCAGGLQNELDAEVKRQSPFCGSAQQIRQSYHGLARMLATDAFMRKSKATTILRASVIPGTAKVAKGRLESVIAMTPNGLVEITAKNWIDATGDAALAAVAGVERLGAGQAGFIPAPFSLGREFLHFTDAGDLAVERVFDADGYVNAADSLDMTRARIETTCAMVASTNVRTSNSFNRTIGIAPLVGIRRGPLAATRYRLTLDDLIARSHFEDAIGITAGRIGGRSGDEANWSRDLAFFINACGLQDTPLASEIPYRAILAEGVDNLLIAGRAAGGTPEAAFAFRMLRDAQRLGEAAGTAAAMATKLNLAAAEVPMQRLKAALILSTALSPWRPKPDPFASAVPESFDGDPLGALPASPANAKKWIGALGAKNAGIALWRLYRLGAANLPKEIQKLRSAKGPKGEYATKLLDALAASATDCKKKKGQ